MSEKRIMIIDIPFNIDMSQVCKGTTKKYTVCDQLRETYKIAQTEAWIERRMAFRINE